MSRSFVRGASAARGGAPVGLTRLRRAGLTCACWLAASGAIAQNLPLKLEREFGAASTGDDSQRPVFASGDAISGSPNGETVIEGHAQVRRGALVVTSDRLTYAPDTERLQATGNVRITRAGGVFSGPRLDLNLATNIGTFESPTYDLLTTGGRGSAATVDFDGPNRILLKDATYSTCQCSREDWYVQSDTLVIDREAEEGQGRGASLHFKGLRVIRLPVFWFPTSDARRSGFLSPSLELGSTTGVEFITPYYLNLAPNYDLVVAPRIMSRRGLQLGGDFRYLSRHHEGEIRAEYTPNDRVTGGERYQWSWRQQTANLWGWNGGFNVNAISDDNYFIDYGRSIITTSERNLPRDAYLTRPLGDWQLMLRTTQYQSILDARDAPPYQRLPQVRLSNTTRDLGGFDLTNSFDATRFSRRLANSVEGWRMVAHPRISYPILRPGSFFTPQFGLHLSSYRLDAAGDETVSIDRAVPTFSLDTGLIFERQASIGAQELIQTLEPRLFYSYTPFREQDDIPIFDTAPTDFGFAQLFSPNLFIGDDRIADVNQITAALLSRLILPESGAERLRLAVAQRLTFGDQLVSIPGVTRRTDRRSDILLAASGDLGDGLSFDSGVQVSLADTRVPRFSFQWRYRPQPQRVFNLGVRYQRDELGQFDTSFQWPINQRWAAIGRINYSWADQQIGDSGVLEPTEPGLIESIFGFQFTEDCWATRFVVQRFATAQGTESSRFFLQLELSGLARLETSSFDILRRSIPGLNFPGERSNRVDPFSVYE